MKMYTRYETMGIHFYTCNEGVKICYSFKIRKLNCRICTPCYYIGFYASIKGRPVAFLQRQLKKSGNFVTGKPRMNFVDAYFVHQKEQLRK